METTVALDQPEWARQRLLWRIFLTPIHVLGILTSIYRISRRYKTRQSGFDDHVASLALFLDLTFFPTLWIRTGDSAQQVPTAIVSTLPNGGGLLGDGLPADLETRMAQVTIGWLVQVVYPLLTWTAKACLALTIARLIPSFHCTHKASIVMACLSVLIGLGILVQTCVYCSEVDKTWTHVPPYRCKVTAAAGSVRIGTEVIVDICLVLIPFCAFFWRFPFPIGHGSPPNHPSPNNPNNNTSPPVRLRLRLPPTTQRLIQLCFTGSLLTTSTAIVSMVLLFQTESSRSLEIRARIGYISFVLCHLTASVSLLVCNLLIVITSLYRLLRTPPRVVEVGKSPVIPNIVNSDSSDASVTRERERTTEESNLSISMAISDTGGHRSTATPITLASTSSRIEFTELFESEFSITGESQP